MCKNKYKSFIVQFHLLSDTGIKFTTTINNESDRLIVLSKLTKYSRYNFIFRIETNKFNWFKAREMCADMVTTD